MWLPRKQAQAEPETMNLADKAEKLRTHFGMEENLPVSAVVTAAIAELGLDAQVKGLNLIQKTDACLAALGTRATATVPVAEAVHLVMPMGVMVDESILTANARVREAEMRAERAEAELRVRNAEMRARAAEEALAQQNREQAEAKARREAEKAAAERERMQRAYAAAERAREERARSEAESRARQTAQARANFPHLVDEVIAASKSLKILAVLGLLSLSLSIPNFHAAGVIEGCCSRTMGLAQARSCREACSCALVVNSIGMVGLILGVCAPARTSAFPAPCRGTIRLKQYLPSACAGLSTQAIATFQSWYCISCGFGALLMITAFALHLPSILTHCAIIGKLDRIMLSLQ